MTNIPPKASNGKLLTENTRTSSIASNPMVTQAAPSGQTKDIVSAAKDTGATVKTQRTSLGLTTQMPTTGQKIDKITEDVKKIDNQVQESISMAKKIGNSVKSLFSSITGIFR